MSSIAIRRERQPKMVYSRFDDDDIDMETLDQYIDDERYHTQKPRKSLYEEYGWGNDD